jgi:hypothetical protein
MHTEPNAQAMAAGNAPREIVTVNVSPPISSFAWDWVAYYDGDEEKGLRGWGPSKEGAIEDLKENTETVLKSADEKLGLNRAWHYDGKSLIVTAGKSPGSSYVANCRFGPTENREANARLIAAAPDLLAACIAWEHARKEGGISMGNWFQVAWNKTEAAIAKAEGKQCQAKLRL